MMRQVGLAITAILLLASSADCSTIGPCSAPCTGCSDTNTFTIEKGTLSSQVTASACQPYACQTTIKNVLNSRSTPVSVDGVACEGYELFPCGGENWSEVDECSDVCYICL